ncbi:carbohydrate ABC transporter permease [Paenibacillus doosanensis]|uniref:L-arabinose transport system permease protein AraQ n=1 Tax=Paenibacillus konkukensis TaxID=2020716 RepID=A0ABY4RJ32_9BACL|nr:MULTISPECIES: carbohydrate ABC transporter permease [Paenibacillus]MCS7462829.1 carbohydrate ABC transporter permease [Paenibacillus doosanensis]UQZ82441.1 L-arabinose transport system permease protein AraQ [Paenibacillus konkukensis]
MIFKKTIGETIFDSFNHILLVLFGLVSLYPLLYVLFASFSEPAELAKHTGILLKPLGFSVVGYEIVFNNPNIIIGYMNTIIYVVVGTCLNVLLTAIGAYVLSRKNLMLKKPMMIMIVFTMYFGGGLIPHFLLVKNLGMYDSRLALIIPGIIATWNLIVMRTAFNAIPDSLEESAKIDGANDFVILFRIILPVTKATLAVMVLFYAVGHWNSWFNAMIYLRDRGLFPLQLLLREILIANSAGGNLLEGASVSDDDQALVYLVIKYCTIIVATVPILFIYPFCQKYFMKGVMLGSLKG